MGLMQQVNTCWPGRPSPPLLHIAFGETGQGSAAHGRSTSSEAMGQHTLRCKTRKGSNVQHTSARLLTDHRPFPQSCQHPAFECSMGPRHLEPFRNRLVVRYPDHGLGWRCIGRSTVGDEPPLRETTTLAPEEP